MPRGDGTGPMGMGPMTGRGAGYCADYGMPGYANPLPGRGYGMGFGRGRGFRGRGFGRGGRHGFHPGWTPFGGMPFGPPAAPPDPDLEKRALKAQADSLRAELDDITKRLGELEANAQVE